MNRFIKKYRIIRGLSQKDFSSRVGISQSYLSEIENNKRSFTITTLYKFAKVLEICPKDLIYCEHSCNSCSYNKNR